MIASPILPRSRSTSRPPYTPPSTSRRTPNRIPNPPYSISSYLCETPPKSGRDIQQIIYRQKEASAERKQNMAIKLHSPMKAYLDKIRQELIERIEYEVMQSEDPKTREFIASSYNTSPSKMFSSTPPRTMISSSRSTPVIHFQTPIPSAIVPPDSEAPRPSPFPIISLDSIEVQNSDYHPELLAYSENVLAPTSSFCTILLCICTLAILFLMFSPITHRYVKTAKVLTSVLENRIISALSLPPIPTPGSKPLDYPTSRGNRMHRESTRNHKDPSNIDSGKSHPVSLRKRRISDMIGIPIKIIKKVFSKVFKLRRRSK